MITMPPIIPRPHHAPSLGLAEPSYTAGIWSTVSMPWLVNGDPGDIDRSQHIRRDPSPPQATIDPEPPEETSPGVSRQNRSTQSASLPVDNKPEVATESQRISPRTISLPINEDDHQEVSKLLDNLVRYIRREMYRVRPLRWSDKWTRTAFARMAAFDKTAICRGDLTHFRVCLPPNVRSLGINISPVGGRWDEERPLLLDMTKTTALSPEPWNPAYSFTLIPKPYWMRMDLSQPYTGPSSTGVPSLYPSHTDLKPTAGPSAHSSTPTSTL
ncbi:hypothetical protein RBB50_011803 [Rhinocladiella similis]